MAFIKQHFLLVAVIVVVLVGAAWYEFTSSGPAPTLTTTDVATSTDSQDATLVTTLLQLQSVTLSGTILSDPGFLSLQDFTTQIQSEPIGRPNPFAPLSPGSPSLSSSTQKISPTLFAPKASDQ